MRITSSDPTLTPDTWLELEITEDMWREDEIAWLVINHAAHKCPDRSQEPCFWCRDLTLQKYGEARPYWLRHLINQMQAKDGGTYFKTLANTNLTFLSGPKKSWNLEAESFEACRAVHGVFASFEVIQEGYDDDSKFPFTRLARNPLSKIKLTTIRGEFTYRTTSVDTYSGTDYITGTIGLGELLESKLHV